MSIGMTWLFVLAWTAASVVIGLIVGPMLGRMSDSYPPANEEEKR
jgi:hypothetical protein